MVVVNQAMRQGDRLIRIDLVKGGMPLGDTLQDVCQPVCRGRGQTGVSAEMRGAHPQYSRGQPQEGTVGLVHPIGPRT